MAKSKNRRNSKAFKRPLSTGVKRLFAYRARASLWVRDKINIELAQYRDAEDLNQYLDIADKDAHRWARQQLAQGRLKLNRPGESRSYQADALDIMSTPGRYALQWANGCSKTTIAALLVLWFLDVYPGARVVTTAGTWSQLKEQFWRELAHWTEQAKTPIVAQEVGVNKTQIDIAPDWYAIGRAASQEAKFEGVHGRYVMVVMDEAKAIKPEIYNAVRRILRGNPETMFWWVALSSPGSPSGPFYEITNGDSANRWTTLRMSAYESPRVTFQQITDDIDEIGESSPLFITMNLGEFPDEGEDVIIPLSHVLSAVDRTDIKTGWPRTLGVDVARYGGDEIVFCDVNNRVVTMPYVTQKRSLADTQGRIKHMASIYNAIGIDDNGMGGGIQDNLKADGLPVIGLNAGSGAVNSKNFANLGTEMLWALAQVFAETHNLPPTDLDNPVMYADKGITIPNDKRLIHQLASRRYSLRGNGQIIAQSKDEIKGIGERSPDRADALALAWWARRSASEMLVTESKKRVSTDNAGGFFSLNHDL